MKTVQCPQITAVLAADRQTVILAKIALIDMRRCVYTPLFQQQRPKRVARRVHPGTRLIIGKRVLGGGGAAQQVKTRLDITGVIGHLAPHHQIGNGEDGIRRIVEKGMGRRYRFPRLSDCLLYTSPSPRD